MEVKSNQSGSSIPEKLLELVLWKDSGISQAKQIGRKLVYQMIVEEKLLRSEI